ncbi:MAG TPA: hypothetical protein VKV25_00565 [Acidimicrobiales bacterium]|nr:hypothetical protein [Acidimicrobiales bacterium]
MRAHSGAARRLTDAEIVDRLQETFRREAAAVAPYADRPRAIAAFEARRARAITRGRRIAGGVAAAALAAAAVALTLVAEHPATTRVGVIAGAGRSRPAVTTAPTLPLTSTGATRTERPSEAPARVRERTAAGTTLVPAGFVPLSVTFDPTPVGWVLGTVPCGTTRCLDLAHTTDAGASWTDLGDPVPTGVAAPILPSSAATAAGVDLSVRFGGLDGWIYGTVGGRAVLWASTNGGMSWAAEELPSVGAGTVLERLETAGGLVQVVALTASPPMVHILTAPVGVDRWDASSVSLPIGYGGDPSPDLVLQQSSGWLAENDGAVVGGARTSDGQQWSAWTPPCTDAGSVLLASPQPSSVVALCSRTGAVWRSSDGGSSFVAVGQLPTGFTAASVAAATPRQLVAGGRDGTAGRIVVSADGGRTWTAALSAAAYPTVRQIGFEDAAQGIAVASGPSGAELLMTYDGGRTWQPVDFQR